MWRVGVSFSVIILAAGRGTRMHSGKPKVLQLLAGKPLLHHVLNTVQQLDPAQTLVVCGYKGELLQEACKDFKHLDWVWQTEQHGTGHAVQTAYPSLTANQRVLVLCGDVPLVSKSSLEQLLAQTPEHAVGILTAVLDNPAGLGRIIRNQQQQIISIVEEKDATPDELNINEINTGIYVLPYAQLASWLGNLKPNNQQQEYYLTDIIKLAVADGVDVVGHKSNSAQEITGINSQQQLATLEREVQLSAAINLMAQGVKLYDPNRIDIRGNIQVGKDVVIDVNAILEGDVVIGDEVYIGPNVIIKNSTLESGVKIYANSVIDTASIGSDCEVGPFARIRPGTNLKANCKIGNFVETKNSAIGPNSKINHLSYIGDAEIGSHVNIGAGVITCNYDGAAKHKTIIEDEVFIGSNCELIAPVTIGKGATLGAGTTLMKDAPAGALTLTKKIITSIVAWQRPVKHKEEL